MAPLLLAGIPFALIMGTTAAAKGLSPAETGLMSGFVFAGSAQFIAVGLWTHPIPIFVLVATTWMVNLRHLLMSASIGPQMGRFSRRQSYFGLFFLADEIWAVALRRAAEGKLTPAYYFGQSLPFWVSWVFWSTMGNILGSTISDPSRYGFDYAFVAVFLVILFGFCRNRSSLIPIAVSAATALHRLEASAQRLVHLHRRHCRHRGRRPHCEVRNGKARHRGTQRCALTSQPSRPGSA